jgi:hypothetical protein
MKKVFLLALLLTITTCSWAAPNPKATGDANWNNTYANGASANTTFNAINTTPTGPEAKGSLIYTDPNVTYTMDIKWLVVSGKDAYFAGPITSVTPAGGSGGCCAVGNWVFYHVQDNGEPGIGYDKIWGEDLTQGEHIVDSAAALLVVLGKGAGANYLGAGFLITDGNLQVH